MSISLSNVQQTEFDALVKIEYRSRGFLLRDTVRMRTDIIGNTCQFRKVGQVVANQVAFQNTIAIQDPNFTAQTAILHKYAAGTGVDTIQDLTVNFDSKRELAFIVAMAIGRRSDQIILDAMSAALTGGTTVISDIGNAKLPDLNTESNMTYKKMRTVVGRFDQNAVPIGERFCSMSGSNLRNVLQAEQIISRFYTSSDNVVDGNLNYKELLGMNIRILPDMVEGGLPLFAAGSGGNPSTSTTSVRACYAWHKMSTGMAIGQDMRTEVSYLPRETTYFVNGLFYAGAVVVDNRGIFQINCNETGTGDVAIN